MNNISFHENEELNFRVKREAPLIHALCEVDLIAQLNPRTQVTLNIEGFAVGFPLESSYSDIIGEFQDWKKQQNKQS